MSRWRWKPRIDEWYRRPSGGYERRRGRSRWRNSYSRWWWITGSADWSPPYDYAIRSLRCWRWHGRRRRKSDAWPLDEYSPQFWRDHPHGWSFPCSWPWPVSFSRSPYECWLSICRFRSHWCWPTGPRSWEGANPGWLATFARKRKSFQLWNRKFHH